ncbi:MAG: radical SAM protein [Oscillospiraceae bacterium]|nr:radical SAM protein [Oscillospiraceae bacterium]
MDITKLKSRPIYLMPIDVISLSLCVILQSEGCDVRAFFDNNSATHGKSFRGVNISSPTAAEKSKTIRSEGGVVIVSGYKSGRAISTQLQELGITNILPYDDILSLSDFELFLQVFKTVKSKELYDIAPVLSDLNITAELRIKQALLPQYVKDMKEDAQILSHLNLVITERCSLRCESCSTLIQYFDKPEEVSFEDAKRGMQLLLNSIDYVRNISILGGEPFLHSRLADIADFVCQSDRVGTVTINTNATILPDKPLCLRLSTYKNLMVVISDYGKLSKHKNEIIKLLKFYGIPYELLRDMVWYGQAKLIDAHSRNDDEVQETFRTCNMNCAALYGLMFSKCQSALSLERLRAIPPEYSEYESVINLSNDTCKQSVIKHLNSEKAMGACFVCSGKSRTNTERIPPAIQASKPLLYRKY